MRSSLFRKGYWYWWEADDLSHGPFVSEEIADAEARMHCKKGNYRVAASAAPLPVEQLAPPQGLSKTEYVEACRVCMTLLRRLQSESPLSRSEVAEALPALMKVVKTFARQLLIR